MSLNQLLVIGKSISNLKDRPNRYKMAALHPLPEFGQAKTRQRQLLKDLLSNSQDVCTQKNATKRQLHSASAKPDQKTMNPQAVFRPNEYAQNSGTALKANAIGLPAQRTFWSLLKRYWPQFKRQKSLEAPIQEELTLDSIRPVCNDLNESDLEIMRRATNSPANPFMKSIRPKNESAQARSGPGQLWSQITKRLFRS
jgi:hypothetical protein